MPSLAATAAVATIGVASRLRGKKLYADGTGLRKHAKTREPQDPVTIRLASSKD